MKQAQKQKEIEHSRKIQNQVEKIWGWSTPAGELRVQRRLHEFLPALQKNKLVLEIGCGTGVFTNIFSQNGIRLIGLDISYDLLKKATTKNPHNYFVQADAENIPFKTEVFDSVVGVSVLHHLNAKVALQDIKRVLKENGMVQFSEPNMTNPQIFLQKNITLLRVLMKETATETAFFRWHLKRLIETMGFKQVCIRPFEFLHPLTPFFATRLIKKIERALERLPFVREVAGSLLINAKKKK